MRAFFVSGAHHLCILCPAEMTPHLFKPSPTASLQNLHRNLSKNLWFALLTLYELSLRVRLTPNNIGETTLYKQNRSAEQVSDQLAT